MKLITKQIFISFLFLTISLGGCGDFEGNYDEVETDNSKGETDTNSGTDLYTLFSGSSVNVIWNGNPSQTESGIWCTELNDCNCGIGWSGTPSSVEFQATIKGTYPPFSVLWYYDSNTYTDNFTISSISSGSHSVKLYVTDNKSNTVYAKCRSGDQGEIMMNFNS